MIIVCLALTHLNVSYVQVVFITIMDHVSLVLEIVQLANLLQFVLSALLLLIFQDLTVLLAQMPYQVVNLALIALLVSDVELVIFYQEVKYVSLAQQLYQLALYVIILGFVIVANKDTSLMHQINVNCAQLLLYCLDAFFAILLQLANTAQADIT